MASITFSGQLDQAMNEAAAEGNKILFIPQQTVGEVLPGAASELVVESDGLYSITLSYNTYSIYHYSDVTKRRTLLATDIVVSADTEVSTIPDLIGSTVPVTEDSVLTIQGYLTEAQESATAAATSESNAAASEAAVTNRVAAYEVESTNYLINTFDGSNLSTGDVVRTLGYYTAGDGGGAEWVKTGETGTASQSPIDVGVVDYTAALYDSAGVEFSLEIHGSEIVPLTIGAAEDIDSSSQLSLAFAIMRSLLTDKGQNKSVVIDGKGCNYLASESINATKLSGWNYKIVNMSIIGSCLGSSVLDFTGSRGGTMENVLVYGDEDNMPTFGIQFARSSDVGYGYCDNWLLTNVSTAGYFSKAGFLAYAQETTHYDHCRFWNYNKDGRAAYLTRSDSAITTTSYVPIVTGSQSYINNTYTSLDARYVPAGNSASIVSITLESNPTVTVDSTLDWVDGDFVCFPLVGMDSISYKRFTISDVTDTTFTLVGADTSSDDSFSGEYRVFGAQSASTLYMSGTEQHRFDGCYVVSYGKPKLQIEFVDNNKVELLSLDFLFEGYGSPSLITFSGCNNYNAEITGLTLKSYNVNSTTAILSHDAAGENDLTIKDFECLITSTASDLVTPNLFSNRFDVNIAGAELTIPYASQFDNTDYMSFSGIVTYLDSGNVIQYSVNDNIVTYSPTPTVSADSGDWGSVTFIRSQIEEIGNRYFASFIFTIDDVGTASGEIYITLSGYDGTNLLTMAGKEYALTGDAVVGMKSSLDTLRISFADASTQLTTGHKVAISGFW